MSVEDELPRSGSSSKLRESINTFGSNSYYYAHSRKIEIPADAIKIEGEGLVTGGNPVLLGVGQADQPLTKPIGKRLTSYAWVDDAEKIKIYVEDADWLQSAAESPVEVDFNEKSFSIRATRTDGTITIFSVAELDDLIVPENCSYRLSPGKRFTVSLKKKVVNKTWYSLKKT